MDAYQFVDAIRTEVLQAAAKDTLKSLEKPPGRRPDPRLVELSSWYNGLSEVDRDAVGKVAGEVAHAAVFGLLCVLDNVRAIQEESGGEGTLKLLFEENGQETRINAPNVDSLHDILNSEDFFAGGL